MKLCLFLVATAAAVAPPRIELDLSPKLNHTRLTVSEKNYAARCPAGSSDISSCPFPVAKAFDHLDGDISSSIETTVLRVDVDGVPCDKAASNCQVTTVDFSQRATYVFLYNVKDGSDNRAEQVVYELVLDDTTYPVINMCTNTITDPSNVRNNTEEFELWEAAATPEAVICTGATATDNIDSNSVMQGRLRYELWEIDGNNNKITRLCPEEPANFDRDADLARVEASWPNDDRFIDYSGPNADLTCANDALSTTNVGHYLFTLKACDRAGTAEDGHEYAAFRYSARPPYDNCVTAEKAIIIEDSIPPTITVNGAGTAGNDPVLHECATNYAETYPTSAPSDGVGFSAFVTDQLDDATSTLINIDATIQEPASGALISASTANTVPPMNTMRLGVHTIRYNARDSKGGAGAKNMKEGLAATQKTRQVEVKDTTPPVATLVGATEIVHHVGQAKNCTTMPCYDPWANCTDTCDTTIAPPASNHADEWEGGKVWNERVPGTYVRRYWCEDASGNTDYVRRTITIVDKGDPIITVMGDSDLTIDASNTVEYTDEGATCNDYVDGVLSHAVEVSGHVVNMQQPGVYTIKYDCMDLANNAATQMTRKVTVVDRTCPTITIKGESTIYLEAGFNYTDQGADGYDDLDVTTFVTTVNDNIYTQNKYHRARSCSEIRQVAQNDYAGGWNGVPSGFYYITSFVEASSKFVRIRVFCDMEKSATYKKCEIGCTTSATGASCADFGLQLLDWTKNGGRAKTDDLFKAGEELFANKEERSLYMVADGTATNKYLCSTNDVSGDTNGAPDMNWTATSDAHAHDWTTAEQSEYGKFVISYHTQDNAGNTEATRHNMTGAPWSGTDCPGGTPKRTVIVKDTLPPVIHLHLKNQDSPSGSGTTGRVIHKSQSGQVGIGGAAFSNTGEVVSHEWHVWGTNYAAAETANQFMAESATAGTSAWVWGAAASAVAGLALLGYSQRKQQAAVIVEV